MGLRLRPAYAPVLPMRDAILTYSERMIIRSFALVTAVAAMLCAITVEPALAKSGPVSTVTWRMSPEANRVLARPGQRIRYTMTLRQVRDPAAVAAWLCAPQPARAVCQRENLRNLRNPLVVDDLNIVSLHARYDDDVRGAPGTSATTLVDGPSMVIVARPVAAGARTAPVRFTFTVTVRRHTRPGTVIRNMALVMFTVTNIRSGNHPLSNCPLDVPLFAVPNPDGNLEEAAPSPRAQEATAGGRLASCFASTVVPPNPGGAMTGFGGMAGHVGNLR